MAPTVAAVVVLCDPNLFAQGYYILSDTLFTLLLALAAFYFILYVDCRRSSCLLLSSVLLTSATFVRPVALFLPFLLLPLVPRMIRNFGWTSVVPAVLAISVYVGSIGVWTERNARVADARAFATVSNVNLYEYVAAATAARGEDRTWEEVRSEFTQLEQSESLSTQAALDSTVARSFRTFREYPIQFFYVLVRGAITNALDPGSGEILNQTGIREPDSGIIYRYVSMSTRDFVVYLFANELPLLISLAAGLAWVLALWVLAALGLVTPQH